MSSPLRFDADRGDSHLRLDQVIVRRVMDVSRVSRSLAQRWIEAGAVTVDGRLVRKPASPVRAGATIVVAIPPSAVRRARPAAEDGPLDVLFEDGSLIAVNKPPGQVVHPSYRQVRGTLVGALLWRLRDRPAARPGIVTRLDKDTSGVVVAALAPGVHAVLQRDGAAGRISKEYLALVRGEPRPRRGRIDLPLAHDPRDRRRMAVSPGGAPSETRYDVVSTRNGIALVRCELVTGRTHQIRVHLAHRGWPVLGDRLYGEADPRIGRQALHAWRIVLPHPATRARIELAAPLPPDMALLVHS
jgi:23S rRNA pseudouridine1911/1915/1917 synthase